MAVTMHRRPIRKHRAARQGPSPVPKRVIVVVPTHGEGAAIVGDLARMRVALPDALLLLVDGAEGNRTAEFAQGVAPHLGNIAVVGKSDARSNTADGVAAIYGLSNHDVLVLRLDRATGSLSQPPAAEDGKNGVDVELAAGALRAR